MHPGLLSGSHVQSESSACHWKTQQTPEAVQQWARLDCWKRRCLIGVTLERSQASERRGREDYRLR